MDWRLKGALQGLLARVPGGMPVNSLLQRALGGRRALERHIAAKVVDDWVVHVGHLRELGIPLEGTSLVEVGTGWLPVLPLCFSLAGAARCRTYDLNRHLSPRATLRTIACLEQHLPAIARASGRDERSVRARFAELAACPDAERLLETAGVEYLAPGDAACTGLPDRSVDLVLSNSVLEHVPAEAVDRIMRESNRILRPGGLALHSVNCGDHYAYFDRSISPINYLRFSERQWRHWNNDILFQNRLRPRDFLESARGAGLRVVLDRHRARPELLELLPRLQVDPSFGHYPPAELCSTSVDFAATPGSGDPAPEVTPGGSRASSPPTGTAS